MLATVGYWGSFVTGILLLVASGWGVWKFYPGLAAPKWSEIWLYSWGMMFTIFSLGSNTAYWQVFGQLALAYEWMVLGDLRLLGFYLDVLFKGSGIIGIWMMLRSLSKNRT